MLLAIGIGCTVLPLVLFALQDYSSAFVCLVGLLIGPYFAFLGYVMAWGGLVGSTEPPFARTIGSGVRRASRFLMRDLKNAGLRRSAVKYALSAGRG